MLGVIFSGRAAAAASVEMEKAGEARARERRARERTVNQSPGFGLGGRLFGLAPELREAFLRLIQVIFPEE